MKDEEKTESRRQKAESSQDYIVLPPAACLPPSSFRLAFRPLSRFVERKLRSLQGAVEEVDHAAVVGFALFAGGGGKADAGKLQVAV